MEKLFPSDMLSKRERVERTLRHQSVDRVALHEQLSYNPGVISLYTGKKIDGYDYTVDDICWVIRQTMDMCFAPVSPRGTDRTTDEDGFVTQNDNWTGWHVSRPFSDVEGARGWLQHITQRIARAPFDAAAARRAYRSSMSDLQGRIGETVILAYSMTGFCSVFDRMGLELFSYFIQDWPGAMTDFMEASAARELSRIEAVVDAELSPVILIPEDFSTKQGPIFSRDMLQRFHYPYVKMLVDAWHQHGILVIYHSDGNYRKAIPDLIDCGVDGFYCLEPNCGMDIVELKHTWPHMTWAGGLDGVDLMERGTPEQVRAEVHRHIRETRALEEGGIFIATSSEINPPIKPRNFKAMVDASGEIFNADFRR
jgi:hypothetical protein